MKSLVRNESRQGQDDLGEISGLGYSLLPYNNANYERGLVGEKGAQDLVKLAATPNPVPYRVESGTSTITWGTSDGFPGQVYVSVNGGPEQLFASGAEGSQEAPWIGIGTTYEFRLYSGTERKTRLAAVTVTRSDPPWDLVSSGLLSYASKEERIDDIARLLAKILQRYAYSPLHEQYFRHWEEHGFHLTPVHFYQPIPDTRTLTDELWAEESELVGVEMNDAVQLELLQKVFPRFRAEYEQFPTDPTECPYEFYFNNNLFSGTDALVLYCMVRHFRPDLILEVGSGFSSRVSGQAALKNGHTKLTCIEPYPDAVLKNGFPGLTSLIRKEVQEVDLELFQRLGANDILFIDTSHVVKTGGDVNYLFLEVLPRLNPGVIVHVHDIFFPKEYPKSWVTELFRFWSEQYLLQAFLSFNSAYEVLFCNNYVGHKYGYEMKITFPTSPWHGGLSLWMRRKSE